MRRRTSLLFCILHVILGATWASQTSTPGPGTNRRLCIICAKNIELLGVLANLNEDQETLHPLARELQKPFLAFKDHEAVKRTQKLLKRESRESICRLGVHLTDLPEARLLDTSVSPLKKSLLADYVTLVRKFHAGSRFEAVWENIRSQYEVLKNILSDKLAGKDLVRTMEDFYGLHKATYTLIFTPQFSRLRLETEIRQGKQSHAYVIFGPGENGLFRRDFISAEDLVLTVAVHEFGHILVEPILKKNEKLLKEYSHLYSKAKKGMKKFGYESWYSVFLENLLRSIEAKIAADVFDETTARKVLEKYGQEGFSLAGVMFAILDIYEKNRFRFQSLEQFLPILLENLDKRIENS